jgi:hypothetical protein
MPLALYRRHRQECKGGHPHNSRTSEYDERKKGWKRCECPIFASGTLHRKFRRHNTGQWEFESARAVAAALERAKSGRAAVQEAPPTEEPRAARITIEDATEAFFAKCRNRNIAPNTLTKYRTFTNQLESYCYERGYVHIDQLNVTDMDRFYASWKDGIRAKAKKLERLKRFIKFCVKMNGSVKDIADDLEVPEGSSIAVPKSPFTDEEADRLYIACDKSDRNSNRTRRLPIFPEQRCVRPRQLLLTPASFWPRMNLVNVPKISVTCHSGIAGVRSCPPIGYFDDWPGTGVGAPLV